MIDQKLFASIVKQASGPFLRRYPWLDAQDLQQEAWVAMLAALPRYQEDVGTLAAFLYRTAHGAMKVHLWRSGTLVKLNRQKANCQTWQTVRHAERAELDNELLSYDRTAHEELEAKEAREALALVVAKHLAAGREGEAALAVMTGEMQSGEAAEAFGLPVAKVYRETFATMRRIRKDRRLEAVR